MPRAGLSRSVVIAEAAELVDEVGWDQLTMAGVADRLGVRLPSLYKHIGSLDDLRRGIGLLALAELRDVLGSAAIGRAGPGCPAGSGPRLRAPTPVRTRDDTPPPLRLPARATTSARNWQGGYWRSSSRSSPATGSPGDDAVHATRVLRAALHGFVTLEASGGFGMPQDIGRQLRVPHPHPR